MMKRENRNVLSFFIFLKSAIILKNSRIEHYDLLSWHHVWHQS